MRSLLIVCCLLAVSLPSCQSVVGDGIYVEPYDPTADPCQQGITCNYPCTVSTDANGCETCTCPNDCRSFGCRQGYVCRNTCTTTGCERYECVLQTCRPVTCAEKCVSGYWNGADGCPTCKCNDACEKVTAGVNETCVANDLKNPALGYTNILWIRLSCPRIRYPFPCYPGNRCRHCILDPWMLFCPRHYWKCLDCFGCYVCARPILIFIG